MYVVIVLKLLHSELCIYFSNCLCPLLGTTVKSEWFYFSYSCFFFLHYNMKHEMIGHLIIKFISLKQFYILQILNHLIQSMVQVYTIHNFLNQFSNVIIQFSIISIERTSKFTKGATYNWTDTTACLYQNNHLLDNTRHSFIITSMLFSCRCLQSCKMNKSLSY